jgi:aspartate--ammonia ligase
VYLPQFDWELRIDDVSRTLEFLKETVRKIYGALRKVERQVVEAGYTSSAILPEDITFLHTEELEAKYPDLTPMEREKVAAKEYGAIFLIGIGHPLPISGKPHDDRAPDYDDWHTANGNGEFRGLNGDIILWDEARQTSLEISSMGIRVNKTSLEAQATHQNVWDRIKGLEYH